MKKNPLLQANLECFKFVLDNALNAQEASYSFVDAR